MAIILIASISVLTSSTPVLIGSRAWTIGTRNALRALLLALLEPVKTSLRALEMDGDYTARLGLLEELKGLPFGAVWDYYCLQQDVPVGFAYMDEIRTYEKRSSGSAWINGNVCQNVLVDQIAIIGSDEKLRANLIKLPIDIRDRSLRQIWADEFRTVKTRGDNSNARLDR